MCRPVRRASVTAALVLLGASVATFAAESSQHSATWLTLKQVQGEQTQTQSIVASEDQVILLSSPDNKPEARYTPSTDELWLIDNTAREMQRVDRTTGKQLAEVLRAQLGKLKAELAKLPTDQRALSELRMRQLFTNNDANQLLPIPDEVVETSRRGSYAGVECSYYLMKTAEVVVGEACIANADAIPHGIAIMRMMSLVQDLYGPLQAVNPEYMSLVLPGAPMLSINASKGIPVHVALMDENGEVLRSLELTDMQQQVPVPESLRVEPESYQRRGMLESLKLGN